MSDHSTTIAPQQTILPTHSDLNSLRSLIQDTLEQTDDDQVLDVRLFFKLLRHISLCVAITVVILLVHIVVFILLALIFADKSEDSSKQGFWSYSTFFVFTIILLLFLYSLYRIVKLFFIRMIRSFSSNDETDSSTTHQRRNFRTIIIEQLKQTIQEFVQTIQVVFHVSPQREQISVSELRHFLVEVLGLGLLNSTRQRRNERDLEQQAEEEVEETSNLLLGAVATEDNTNLDHFRRHLRLSLMNREFNENDYETLLSLDEHEQEMRDFIQGCSISDLQTLPQLRILPVAVSTITPKTPRNDESTKQETPLHQPTQETETTIPYCSESLAKTILQQKCAICLHRFEGNELFVTLPACLHRFHKECVFEWLSRKNSCPICTHPALQ